MPGIAACLTPAPDPALSVALDRAAAAQDRLGRMRSLAADAPGAGARAVIRPGRLPGADLWADESSGLIVAMDGECYGPAPGAGAQARRLLGPRVLSRGAAAMGALYRELGPGFAAQAEGAFSVVVLDRHAGCAHAFTDRFGLRPLAWAVADGAIFFASALSCFTAAFPGRAWGQDWGALADWLAFEHVLGEKTLLDGVTLLPNAGRLSFRAGDSRPDVREYWSLATVDAAGDMPLERAVEHAGGLFAAAVERLASDGSRAGVYLTSGLDSRAIGGFLSRVQPGFASFTYGLAGCRDMVWGRELAGLLGSPHQGFPMDDSSWLFDMAETFVGRTEGFVNILHSHGLHTYEAASRSMDVHLSGYGGGSFYGGDTTNTAMLRAATPAQACETLYHGYVHGLGCVFRSPMERFHLLAPEARRETAWAAEASFEREFARYAGLRPDIAGDAFTLGNRYKKMFAYMIAMEREFFEDRSPFMDYALMEFLFSLPVALRTGRKLQLGLLDAMLPELRAVPWQVSCKCPTLLPAPPPELAHRRDDPMPTEPGRDYPRWVLAHGMEWLQALMDSDALEARGVFSRAHVRELLARVPWAARELPYAERRNVSYSLCAAATFELACRLVPVSGARPGS